MAFDCVLPESIGATSAGYGGIDKEIAKAVRFGSVGVGLRLGHVPDLVGRSCSIAVIKRIAGVEASSGGQPASGFW